MGEWIIQFLETYSPIDVVVIAKHYEDFLWGALKTLELTALSLIIGGIISIPLAIVRAGNNPYLNAPVWMFTYLFRGTPLLVQTYMIYYGLGQFEWIRETFLWGPILSQAYWCALIAFSLNTAAYTTELLRGSIVNTSRGEVEAAKACGFGKGMRMRRIILPSAFRRALPAYSNEVIFMLHGSVVASTITIQDLLGAGRLLNSRYYLAYEGFITAAVLYFIIVLFVSRGFRYWEKHWLAHLYPQDAVKTKPKKGLASFRI
jgi:arginine/ornithine transport system permease protein